MRCSLCSLAIPYGVIDDPDPGVDPGGPGVTLDFNQITNPDIGELLDGQLTTMGASNTLTPAMTA
jgi:hypothetical protein